MLQQGKMQARCGDLVNQTTVTENKLILLAQTGLRSRVGGQDDTKKSFPGVTATFFRYDGSKIFEAGSFAIGQDRKTTFHYENIGIFVSILKTQWPF